MHSHRPLHWVQAQYEGGVIGRPMQEHVVVCALGGSQQPALPPPSADVTERPKVDTESVCGFLECDRRPLRLLQQP